MHKLKPLTLEEIEIGTGRKYISISVVLGSLMCASVVTFPKKSRVVQGERLIHLHGIDHDCDEPFSVCLLGLIDPPDPKNLSRVFEWTPENETILFPLAARPKMDVLGYLRVIGDPHPAKTLRESQKLPRGAGERFLKHIIEGV